MNEAAKDWKACVSQYAVFKGRSTRFTFWNFFRFQILIGVAAGWSRSPVLIGTIALIFFLPSISVAVRRMHDVGKSGWFILVPIYNLILALKPSCADNQYGSDQVQKNST